MQNKVFKATLLIALFFTLQACGGGGGGSAGAPPSPTSNNPPPATQNNAPVAVISPATAEFVAGSVVEFSADQSSDSDGDELVYEWELVSPKGSFAAIGDNASITISFEPDIDKSYTLNLKVTDSAGASSTEQYSFTPTLPSPQSLPTYANTMPSSPVLSDRADAVRFLHQATFGPREADVDALWDEGVETWFSEQLTMEPHNYLDAWRVIAGEFGDIDEGPNVNFMQLTHESFMYNALYSPDQLRQRMTYALSQLFVITERFDFGGHDQLILGYVDTLHTGAFGNFRDLFRDVTLHPAMGMFLAMLGNSKADPEKNIRPDENFARETMQLFSVGLQMLNQDGTPIIDDEGEPVQTYTPVDVQNYAAALTGWYFAGLESYRFGDTFHAIEHSLRTKPMAPYDDYHQKTQKKLLRNYYVPAGQSAEQSLDTVIDSLFFHPNLAPFVSRHLIKSFVTSNPSPEYIARVSAVFNSDEQGERGNLASVLQAVLFDSEARLPIQEQSESYGRVKDPLLKYLNIVRFLNLDSFVEGSYRHLARRPSQTFLAAPSVFNFFSPNHTPNKEFAERDLVAPELQIITADTIVSDASQFAYMNSRYHYLAYNGDAPEEDKQYWNTFDFDPLLAVLEAEGLTGVVDYLDVYLAQGRLTTDFKETLLQHFEQGVNWALEGNFDSDENARKANLRDLLGAVVYQVTLTPEFAVQH
jgi:uncharacterized protein (DUF1800 family)